MGVSAESVLAAPINYSKVGIVSLAMHVLVWPGVVMCSHVLGTQQQKRFNARHLVVHCVQC